MKGGDPLGRGAGEMQPEEGWPRDPPDAVGAAGYRRPVQQHDADDLAKAERDDREIVAAQTQYRKTEDDPEARGHETGKRQCFPESKIEVARQQTERVGADRIKRDVAEIEQPG